MKFKKIGKKQRIFQQYLSATKVIKVDIINLYNIKSKTQIDEYNLNYKS